MPAARSISARTIETALPRDKDYTLAIGDGLVLLIKPNGSKWWRFRYRFLGKAKMLSLGIYPDVSLAEAREARDAARKMLANDIDPSEKRKDEKAASLLSAENTFKAIAEEWMERHPPKAESTKTKTKWLLDFAYEGFGHLPIKDVTPTKVLAVCQKEENKEHLETAQRIKVKCSQVFRYAVATGRLERDPTTDLRGALATPEVKHRSAITEPKVVGQLLRDIDGYSGYYTTVGALKLAPLVFIRPGELRAAKWADIDFKAGRWSYTPPKTRNKTQLAHIVPLSKQAIAVLEGLYALTGHCSPYVFPNLRDMQLCMSENTVNAALRRMGYTSEQMCGHGFRATARTILEEVLGFRYELIDHQLAHQVKDTHGRAYNRTKHLPERTRMMQVWADYLDNLRKGADILPFKQQA